MIDGRRGRKKERKREKESGQKDVSVLKERKRFKGKRLEGWRMGRRKKEEMKRERESAKQNGSWSERNRNDCVRGCAREGRRKREGERGRESSSLGRGRGQPVAFCKLNFKY